jgi:hypothetical protein
VVSGEDLRFVGSGDDFLAGQGISEPAHDECVFRGLEEANAPLEFQNQAQ